MLRYGTDTAPLVNVSWSGWLSCMFLPSVSGIVWVLTLVDAASLTKVPLPTSMLYWILNTPISAALTVAATALVYVPLTVVVFAYPS